MEPSEIDKSISELEEKLDRLRALYEQYFCGIEKLEPQIPRKDVERRVQMLRKEQIRNTAMRFKFNTLVQRYNTMQQHWGRVLREIENGTYKRDLARAAARFGVDEALTAVGRKRADRMAAGLKAQLERQGKRQSQQRPQRDDEYEEIGDEDVEALDDDFDDDAPTPPPIRSEDGAPVSHPPASRAPVSGSQPAAWPEQTHPSAAAQAGWNGWDQRPAQARADDGYAQPYAQGSHGYGAQPFAASQPYAAQHHAPFQQGADHAASPGPHPYPQHNVSQPPIAHASVPGGYDPSATPYVSSVRPSTPGPSSAPGASWGPSPSQPPARERKAGGLRLGGGPSKRASAEALNRIASSLGTAPTDSAPIHASEAPAVSTQPVRKPLLSSPLDLDLAGEALGHSEGASPGLRPAATGPVVTPREKLASKPQLAPPPPRVAVSTAGSAASPATVGQPISRPAVNDATAPRAPAPVAPSDEAKPTASSEPVRPVARTVPSAGARPPAKAASRQDDALSETRLREIYSQYVQTRRDRNESTANITFEKLAYSLRSQSDKLKSKHGQKKVDYEVVVKDGKTLIKPIVR